MNKIIISTCILLALTAVFYVHKPFTRSRNIQVYTGDQFYIPSTCKNLALLGCTPHPTGFLKQHDNDARLLHAITAQDFLDVEYVRDSFERTFLLCKAHNVDHLLVAYLPIYYLEMKRLLGEKFVGSCTVFLQRIVKDIVPIMQTAAKKAGFDGAITLITPPAYQLARIPAHLESQDDRIRYLIKQFPALKNITGPSLQTITIINNSCSPEDTMLINYLKYEYLYEKPLNYVTCETGKDRFHR